MAAPDLADLAGHLAYHAHIGFAECRDMDAPASAPPTPEPTGRTEDGDLAFEVEHQGKRFRVEVEEIGPDSPPRPDYEDMRPQWLATLHYNGQREGARRVVVITHRSEDPYDALREAQMEAVRRDGASICMTGLSCVEIPRAG